jgi:response regulator of citrate/malate metabolism
MLRHSENQKKLNKSNDVKQKSIEMRNKKNKQQSHEHQDKVKGIDVVFVNDNVAKVEEKKNTTTIKNVNDNIKPKKTSLSVLHKLCKHKHLENKVESQPAPAPAPAPAPEPAPAPAPTPLKNKNMKKVIKMMVSKHK